ncbi:diguanylate cyclase [Paenibacillus albiflavus]|uniref:histidine kinase n=1 Tax=Paenibacillus albiflavus TaxID=2545760 RepID=A0A4R4EHU9_9BACL|nr:ATP-binding protein [Paenibacillus albiflavus]TCZ79257.1 diguanylate cyclase [Paenibacillus albiflavus]
MSIRSVKLICAPFILLFVLISSLILHHSTNIFFLIITAILLYTAIVYDHKFPWLKGIQFIFLGAFHLASELNWCVLLYYILIVNLIENKKRYQETIPIALLLIMEYSAIRLSYMETLTTYTLLATVFDLMTSLLLVLLFHIFINIETERKELTKQNDYLSNHDALTGLYNYFGYMNKVQQTIQTNKEFLFVLFDINNFKSHNAKDIATANEILVKLSQSLIARFPNHLGASRYAGDRFSILLRPSEQIDKLLNFEELGIQITYSTTRYPQDAITFQHLIHIGEDRIFQMRREFWLKQQEEQSRSDKMKLVGELAASMAHEIRNPLTSIQGFIQLSKNSGYNILPWYDVIMSEITRVGELTAEFLQFSKPHVGNMKNELIASCMARVYSLCEPEATSRGHTIELIILDHAAQVRMDRDKITQVLINLIRNSFQAMEQPGHVQFTLHQEDNQAVIQVRDNGKGIANDEIDKIFDPFYTTKEDGTGLGLSLCQKIIEDHNGEITVSSEVGLDTVFTVKLPIALHNKSGRRSKVNQP